MKNKLIAKIQNEMAKVLRVQQIEDLGKVLTASFINCEIVAAKASAELKSVDSLLQKFISAKRIEGCSDKSLKYYVMTLSNLTAKVDKEIRMISTEDLLGYLYLSRREISK